MGRMPSLEVTALHEAVCYIVQTACSESESVFVDSLVVVLLEA